MITLQNLFAARTVNKLQFLCSALLSWIISYGLYRTGALVPPPDGFKGRVNIHPRIEDSRKAWLRVLTLPLDCNAILKRHLRLDG